MNEKYLMEKQKTNMPSPSPQSAHVSKNPKAKIKAPSIFFFSNSAFHAMCQPGHGIQ